MTEQINASILEEVKLIEGENPQSLVTLLTPLGKILYTAPVCDKILGYTQAELTGRYFGLYIHPNDIPHALLALQDAMLNERSVEVGSRVRRKGGGYVFVRGLARRKIDPATDKTYLISHAKPLSNP